MEAFNTDVMVFTAAQSPEWEGVSIDPFGKYEKFYFCIFLAGNKELEERVCVYWHLL